MGVAIISAVGVLAAALITVAVSLITTNERSARLLREAETLSKLTAGTTAHQMMESRLETSIHRYSVESDMQWNHPGRRWRPYLPLGSVFAVIVWLYVRDRFDITSWQHIYNFALGVLGFVAVASTVPILVDQFRDAFRRSREEKTAQLNESGDGKPSQR